MKKYNLISIIYYLIILLYFLGATYLFFGYLNGNFKPQNIPQDWWTALSVIVTLTIAILIMNFIREKDYLNIQHQISEFKREIENTKQLSSLSTILLDIATDENSNKDKWAKNYNNIKSLYKTGFIKDIELYRISIEAWKQEDIHFAFRLRKLAYEVNPSNLKNKLYFLSILPYINIEDVTYDDGISRLYHKENKFYEEIGFKKIKDNPVEFSTKRFFNKFHNIIKGKVVSKNNECFAYALTGRYLYSKKLYKESEYFFQLAIEETGKPGKRWHYRYLLILNLVNDNILGLKENLDKAKEIKEWKEDFRYLAYQELFNNIVNIIEDKKVTKTNLSIILKGINLNNYDRFTMWNFKSIIEKLQIDKVKKDLMKELYFNFYVFFGSDDKEIKIDNLEDEKSKILNDLLNM